MIKNFKTVFGNTVYLADEKWEHIIHKHPEVKKYAGRIREVLSLPDLVKLSKRDPKVHLYYKYYNDIFNGKHFLVVTSYERESIITAFITDKIKAGALIWQKK